MKKLLILSLTLVNALSLAVIARADVIAATPAEIVGGLVIDNIAVILVAVVVIVTAVLLWRMRKKK